MSLPLKSSFNSISPSAKSLLLNKAFTTIPFAKEAVNLMGVEIDLDGVTKRKNSYQFILRCIHFETRYLSINEALSLLSLNNILEFSSGFSFRGLRECQNPEIFYIDTDLPQILEIKRKLVEELAKKYCTYSINNLKLLELNVLDKVAFTEITKKFPTGPIAIVNEGLLMYLDQEQKQKLCSNLYDVLQQRGGYWITADVYVKKNEQSSLPLDIFNKGGRNFLNHHDVEEHKFESFEAAKDFFKSCGFEVYRKIEIPPEKVSSRKWLRNVPREILKELKSRVKTRETWILQSGS
jgi:O-methyltransferase involved in polyketide biosynthesis